MTLVIILVLSAVLFGLSFGTKRRFGVLGLALAAGVVLAQYASSGVGQFFESVQLPVAPLGYDVAAIITIVLAPALLLLAGGPTYRDRRSAFIGATGFALLGTLFVIGPLTTALPVENEMVRSGLVVIAQWQGIIVIIALVLAVVDTFMVHGVARRHQYNKHDKH